MIGWLGTNFLEGGGLNLTKNRDRRPPLHATPYSHAPPHEKKKVIERLRNWSTEQLASEGLAVFGLDARADGDLFGEKLVRLEPLRLGFFDVVPNGDEDNDWGGGVARCTQ